MPPSTTDVKPGRSSGNSGRRTKTRTVITTPVDTPVQTPCQSVSTSFEPFEAVIGDYRITVKGNAERAIASVIARETDVILYEPEVLPERLPEVAGKAPELNAFEVARQKAIAAYHQATLPNNGLIDVDVLVEHPYNRSIYGVNESVEDLVKFLEKEDGQVFKIVVNKQGQIVSGNRRVQAAREVNRRCAKQGVPPKFQLVEAEIVSFSSVEGELKHAILQNQSRTKSSTIIAEEIRAVIALSKNSSIPEKQFKPAEAIERLQSLLRQNGSKGGRTAAFDLQATFRKVEDYKNKDLVKRLQAFASDSPSKAKDLVDSTPPSALGKIDIEVYQEKILDRLDDNPLESVKRAAEAVSRDIIAGQLEAPLTVSVASVSARGGGNSGKKHAKSGEPQEKSQDDVDEDQEKDSRTELQLLIDAAIAAGDNPSDNRKTPKEFVALAEDILGEIDLDSFAALTDPGWVPAKKAYTILDNAFSLEHKGNVFCNPPFSRASDALKLIASEISKGHVQRLFLILPAKVESTRAYHGLINDHNPLILQPSKRLAFEPGELLLNASPNATAEGNSDPSIVIMWSYQDADYDYFYECSIGYGLVFRQYAPFNPHRLPKVFDSLKWDTGRDGVSRCNVFGTLVEIAPSLEGFVIRINNRVTRTIEDEFDARAIAIMTAIDNLR